MLPVFLYARSGLLPPVHKKIPIPLPPEMHFTKWLIETLPEIVPAVLHQVDGWPVDKDEVLIIPELFHPWAVSANDILLDVRAPELPGSSLLQEARTLDIRDRLNDDLHGRIFDFWRDRPIPSIAITVR